MDEVILYSTTLRKLYIVYPRFIRILYILLYHFESFPYNLKFFI